MARLRHRTGAGYTYFVTTRSWEGRTLFRVPEVARIVAEQILHYRGEGFYLLHAFVIMPDHVHVLLTPGSSVTLEKAVQLIKGGSSHRVHTERNHKMSIWQAGFHDWTVRDEDDFRVKVAYIHSNPVKARLVEKAELWPYSSASGKFAMDEWPQGRSASSGAEAPAWQVGDVGAEAPTPQGQRQRQ